MTIEALISSIVAVDARTGKYKWHYQETPGDSWDFDAIADKIDDFSLAEEHKIFLREAGVTADPWVMASALGASLEPELLLHSVGVHGIAPERLADTWRELVTDMNSPSSRASYAAEISGAAR